MTFNPEPFDDFYPEEGNFLQNVSPEPLEDIEIQGELTSGGARATSYGIKGRMNGRLHSLMKGKNSYPAFRRDTRPSILGHYYRPVRRHLHSYPAPLSSVHPWTPHCPCGRCSERNLISQVQVLLNRVLSLDIPPDGILNRETRSALRMLQMRAGLPVTGQIGPKTMDCITRLSCGTCFHEVQCPVIPGYSQGETEESEWGAIGRLRQLWDGVTSNKAQSVLPYVAKKIISANSKRLNVLSAEEVIWIQTVLDKAESENLKIDGFYGPLTRAAVRRFQARYTLLVDGVVGPQTRTALIQRCLNRLGIKPALPVNGVMDNSTRSAIRSYQSKTGLKQDGIVGPKTRAAMAADLKMFP